MSAEHRQEKSRSESFVEPETDVSLAGELDSRPRFFLAMRRIKRTQEQMALVTFPERKVTLGCRGRDQNELASSGSA